MVTRRELLTMIGCGLGAATCAGWAPASAAAAPAGPRLLVVLLRGGLDGVHAVPPVGDPGYSALRGPLALSPDGATEAGGAALRLDGTFALHPSLAFCAGLYARHEFLPIVAAAPPYWGRSHFEAQDCVENGSDSPSGAETGWLNRAVGCLHDGGLSATTVMPLILRGPAKIDEWSPPLPNRVNPILLQRLEPLYGEDSVLAAPFAEAITERGEDAGIDAHLAGARMVAGRRLPTIAAAAGAFLARRGGPRIAFVEDYGWDTHANQAPILARKLAELDHAVHAFHDAVWPAWGRTVAVVVTEFGRTARANGTAGTDHGTGGAMFVFGGAVAGGRVGGQWPGMRPAELYQNRDVHATTDQRAVFKGVLGSHFGLSAEVLSRTIFPGSGALRPLGGLLHQRVAAARGEKNAARDD